MSAHDDRLRSRGVPVRVFRLGEEPDEDLASSTTAEERLDMVAELSRRMWELTGREVPSYSRATIPMRLVRRP